MACGDRYRYLAVTASGLNFENPWDDVETFADFEEWKELARRLGLLAQKFADALGDIEGEQNAGSFERWNAANEVRSRSVATYDALPSFWSGNVAADIGNAQASIVDALCVIEMASDGIVFYGGVPPPLPGAPPPRENPDLFGQIPAWVLPAGFVLAGLWLVSKVRR